MMNALWLRLRRRVTVEEAATSSEPGSALIANQLHAPGEETTTTTTTTANRNAENGEFSDSRKRPLDDQSAESRETHRRHQNKLRQAKKRKADFQSSRCIGIATTCTPSKYPPFDSPDNSVSQMMNSYIQNLQQNDCVARPLNWSEIIHLSSNRAKQPPSTHPWNELRSVHYCVAATNADLHLQLEAGLLLPVLVAPHSALGQEITSQCHWFQQPLEELLDEILKEGQAFVQVQDHAKTSISEFTGEEKCHRVRDRFRMNPQERGCAWNCLEIEDLLPGHKGPKCLEYGAKLLDWQLGSPKNASVSRHWLSLPGAKRIDRWLLVSEEKSASTAHVDVGFATWVSCLTGKKTFWVRNPTVMDHMVWTDFDINHDHRTFQEPWGRIDLYPGYLLIFPPGTIHAVFTEKDTVCCGGHFLTPQVMDRFLDVLRQTEIDPSRTNDLKSGDCFRILENFIKEALDSLSAGLTKAQLDRFVLMLEKYAASEPEAAGGRDERAEIDHLKRRTMFLTRLRQKDWIRLLNTKASTLN